MIETDVLIVGGGPAGSACAWRLNQHHHKALILDQANFPRVKPCAGWITPAVFRHLGITPDDYPYGLTRFSSFKISLKGFRFTMPTHQYAIRRIEFDAWLLERAGTEFNNHRVKNIEIVDGRYIVDDQFSAHYLVGAGGTHCPVRRMLFNPDKALKKDGLIVAKEEEFAYSYHDDRCYLWFFEDKLPGYAWYVPKAEGYLNVGIGGSAQGLKDRKVTLNEHWDLLLEKLEDEGLVTGHDFKPDGHSYYLRSKSPQFRQGNAFLVGDALGLATRDMGEGIGAAIQSGILAADAIANHNSYAINSIPRFSFPSLIGLRK